MRADDFGDQRIKLSHQRASCIIVILKRSFNQRPCVRIIHVIESASTPLTMTGSAALWLQLLAWKCLCQAPVAGLGRVKKYCNRSAMHTVMSFKGAKSALQKT